MMLTTRLGIGWMCIES